MQYDDINFNLMIFNKQIDAKIITDRKLMTWNDRDKKFYVWMNYKDFDDYVQSLNLDYRNFHECINGAQKIKFDIDIKHEINEIVNFDVEAFIKIIIDSINIITAVLCDRSDFIVCTSHGETKKSYHIILQNYFVESNKEVATVTNLVYSLSECIYLDLNVNKIWQNFRILGNCKSNQPIRTKVCETNNWYETLIGNIENCSKLNFSESKKQINEIVCFDKCSQTLIDKIGSFAKGHVFDKHVNNLVLFKRTHSSYCEICKRTHDKDNTFYATIGENGSCWGKCRHGKGHILIESDFLEKPESKEITKDTILPNYNIANTEITGYTQNNIYSQPTMKEFETDCLTLVVHANMKLGKTKELRNYFKTLNPASSVIVSFRQTFTNAMLKHFPDHVNYQDIRGKINLTDHPHLIIQVESLHRLTCDIHPEVLVLDECESIFSQLASNLSQFSSSNHAVFQYLANYSTKAILMDAIITLKTVNLIKVYRKSDWFYHRNNFNNNVDDVYYLTKSAKTWFHNLTNSIKQGKRIAIPTNSLTEAKAIKRYISGLSFGESGNPANIGIYSSETSATVKKEHFSNVDLYWNQYDILIYTPTVTAGISFEVKHFDLIYCWFHDMSCDVETCIQMIGRIRSVSLKNYFIYIKDQGANFPITAETVLVNYKFNRDYDNLGIPQHYYGENGQINFMQSSYLNLHLENTARQNCSRNNFSGHFCTTVQKMGSCVKWLLDEKDFNLKTYVIAKTDSKIETAKILVESETIDNDQYDKLNYRIEDGGYLTFEETQSMQKYKLINRYDRKDKLTVDFVIKYNTIHTSRNYLNLQEIANGVIELQNSERQHYVASLVSCSDREIRKKYKFKLHDCCEKLLQLTGWENLWDIRCMSGRKITENITNNFIDYVAQITQIVNEHNIKGVDPMRVVANVNNKLSVYIKLVNNLIDWCYGWKIKDIGNEVYQLVRNNLFIYKERKPIPII